MIHKLDRKADKVDSSTNCLFNSLWKNDQDEAKLHLFSFGKCSQWFFQLCDKTLRKRLT